MTGRSYKALKRFERVVFRLKRAYSLQDFHEALLIAHLAQPELAYRAWAEVQGEIDVWEWEEDMESGWRLLCWYDLDVDDVFTSLGDIGSGARRLLRHAFIIADWYEDALPAGVSEACRRYPHLRASVESKYPGFRCWTEPANRATRSAA